MKEIYNKVLDEIAVDPRLDSGIFDIGNNDHLALFREYLAKEGIGEEQAIAASNILAETGKFPDRQAYNKNGLLVTFPSPEYKQRALSRGTHFEENPKKSQVNIFADPNQPQAAQPAAQPAAAPAQSATTPQPVVAPVAQSTSTINPATSTPQQISTDNRSPQEKTVDGAAIEKMLKTEYTLKEAVSFGFYQKDNIWYTSEGVKVGRLWYVDNRGTQLILPC
jgi:hypothetical protein